LVWGNNRPPGRCQGARYTQGFRPFTRVGPLSFTASVVIPSDTASAQGGNEGRPTCISGRVLKSRLSFDKCVHVERGAIIARILIDCFTPSQRKAANLFQYQTTKWCPR